MHLRRIMVTLIFISEHLIIIIRLYLTTKTRPLSLQFSCKEAIATTYSCPKYHVAASFTSLSHSWMVSSSKTLPSHKNLKWRCPLLVDAPRYNSPGLQRRTDRDDSRCRMGFVISFGLGALLTTKGALAAWKMAKAGGKEWDGPIGYSSGNIESICYLWLWADCFILPVWITYITHARSAMSIN